MKAFSSAPSTNTKPSRYRKNVKTRNTPKTAYAWLGGNRAVYSGNSCRITKNKTTDSNVPGSTLRQPCLAFGSTLYSNRNSSNVLTIEMDQLMTLANNGPIGSANGSLSTRLPRPSASVDTTSRLVVTSSMTIETTRCMRRLRLSTW